MAPLSLKSLTLLVAAAALGTVSGVAATPVVGTHVASAASAASSYPPAAGAACGSAVCTADQVCCNDSCGICTAPGAPCTMQLCSGGGNEVEEPPASPSPSPASCGAKICAADQVCCNNSCGICTLPGESCTMEFCS